MEEGIETLGLGSWWGSSFVVDVDGILLDAWSAFCLFGLSEFFWGGLVGHTYSWYNFPNINHMQVNIIYLITSFFLLSFDEQSIFFLYTTDNGPGSLFG